MNSIMFIFGDDPLWVGNDSVKKLSIPVQLGKAKQHERYSFVYSVGIIAIDIQDGKYI